MALLGHDRYLAERRREAEREDFQTRMRAGDVSRREYAQRFLSDYAERCDRAKDLHQPIPALDMRALANGISRAGGREPVGDLYRYVDSELRADGCEVSGPNFELRDVPAVDPDRDKDIFDGMPPEPPPGAYEARAAWSAERNVREMKKADTDLASFDESELEEAIKGRSFLEPEEIEALGEQSRGLAPMETFQERMKNR